MDRSFLNHIYFQENFIDEVIFLFDQRNTTFI
jgi:hypothetical protein